MGQVNGNGKWELKPEMRTLLRAGLSTRQSPKACVSPRITGLEYGPRNALPDSQNGPVVLCTLVKQASKQRLWGPRASDIRPPEMFVAGA